MRPFKISSLSSKELPLTTTSSNYNPDLGPQVFQDACQFEIKDLKRKVADLGKERDSFKIELELLREKFQLLMSEKMNGDTLTGCQKDEIAHLN